MTSVCVSTVKLRSILLLVFTVGLLSFWNLQTQLGDRGALFQSSGAATKSYPKSSEVKKNFLVYVKIAKTGSSTLSNIFCNYGFRNRLNMVMSTIPQSLIDTRELEPGNSWDIGPERHPPHIMEQHAKFSRPFHEKHFPNDDTMFVTSVRDPVNWYISFVDFMGAFRNYDPRQVLERDKIFYRRPEGRPIVDIPTNIHNVFLMWLGFDVEKITNVPAIKDHIRWLDNKFRLVMITEYFDESLVLLKRMMNWDMADIFYTYANEATRKSGVVLTEKEKAKLLDKDHNYGDKLVYDHFNKTLWRKVEQEQEFMEEVAVFKTLNRQVVEFCNSDLMLENPQTVLKISTKWDGALNITEAHCISMRLVFGAAVELSAALDKYIPHRNSKTRAEVIAKP